MAEGQMVPSELLLGILFNAMSDSGATRFLVDGFPRTLDQLRDFDSQIKPCDGVLVFSVPEDVAVERLLARGATSGRADDNEDTIRTRMQVFQEESQPVIDYLRDSGVNVHEVDASSESEEVFAAVEPFMDAMEAAAAEKEAAAGDAPAPPADAGAEPEAEAEAEQPPAAEEDGEAAAAAEAADADADAGAAAADADADAAADADSDPAAAAEAEAAPAPAAPVKGAAAADLEEALVVFVLGAPGAGKGTQCDLIKARHGWVHVSTGDLLRAELKRGSAIGQQAQALMSAGQMVPTGLVLDLLLAAMRATPPPRRRFLVDGFPRKLEQLQEFEGRIKPCDGVLVFSVPEDVAVERLLARGATSGRADDNEDTIRTRMQVFQEESQPVIEFLREQGANVAEIEATGEPEEIFAQVATFMDMFGPPLELQEQQEEGEQQEEEAEQQQEQGEEEKEGEREQQGEQEGEEQAAAEQGEQAGEGEGEGEGGYSAEQQAAILRIQAAGRGYLDRKKVAALRAEKMAEGASAAEAQAEAEAEVAAEAQAEAEAEEAAAAAEAGEGAYSAEQEAAILRIQAAGRGYLDRKKVAALRAQKQAEGAPAAEAQAEAEAEVAAEALADAEEAAKKAGAEAYSAEQEAAILRIQAAGRGYLDRKKVAALRAEKMAEGASAAEAAAEAEAELQAEAEAQLAAAEEAAEEAAAEAYSAEQQAAALRIQAAGRGYLDRKRVAAIKAERAAAGKAEAQAQAAEFEARMDDQVANIRGMLVVCGPSGVGKGTLIGRLMAEHGDKFGFSVSHTTRGPRPGEQDGVHYHFTDMASMTSEVESGMFLEHAAVHGNMYGTSLAAVAAVGRGGRVAVLDIDVQGASRIKASRAAAKAVYVFVDPPSMQELEARLRGRGTETEDKVQLRLKNSTAEIERSHEPGFFDARIVNDDLDAAYHRFKLTIERLLPGTFKPADLRPPSAARLPTPPSAPAPPPAAAAPRAASTSARAAAPAPATAPAAATAAATAHAATAAAPAPAATAASSSSASASSSSLPVRQYMDATVVPVLREALRALNEERPADPLQYLADFFQEARAHGGRHPRTGGNGKIAH
ncbi:hypothetical protein CHLRE_08g377350v5 [Chlamydomonas reinhardtii]|uniref:Guanylate kinase 1 n=1 Tax=Chlamydomonas reinhardtii TaxID=3055 RepID=A0A2K3DHS7_CHLRE|nr:uncharacterized protein CHLRE_08g377350v5 [Chlamydomonas reinhardtii]PNW80088.1 hypothetical protein CHLRE_08g377350v5 [Chlamydomonas reinhardtii]